MNHHASWNQVFSDAAQDLDFVRQVLSRRNESLIPRDQSLVLEPFRRTALDKVKVVLIGDYPSETGLVFSVDRDLPVPPEVTAIYRELARTVPGFRVPTHGDLSGWCDQGVLFLTPSLTARQATHKVKGDACSHGALWYPFLSHVLTAVLAANRNVVFLAWGRRARDLFSTLDLGDINILEAPHPGGTFAACDHFDKVNRHLAICASKGARLSEPIDWTL